MRLVIGAVGRLKAGAERDLLARYYERIPPMGKVVGIGPLQTFEIGEGRANSASQRTALEADQLLAKIPADAKAVALDAGGQMFSTKDFSGFLVSQRQHNTPCLAFLVGGPDGHGKSIAASVDYQLSLGPMTLPHGLARIVLAEQLYRALSILTGHPYHRE